MYVPITRNIIYSYNVFFYEIFSSALAYTSQPYAEAMYTRLAVSYIPCTKSSKEQTVDIITFTNFEERNLSSETRDDAESSEEFDDYSIMPRLISE